MLAYEAVDAQGDELTIAAAAFSRFWSTDCSLMRFDR